MDVGVSRLLIFFLVSFAIVNLHSDCTSISDRPGISSKYLRNHKISYFDGGITHHFAVEDTLEIGNVERNQFRFKIDTFANNGHTCSVEGIASKVGEHFEFHEPLDMSIEATGGKALICVLRFKFSDSRIELEDVDHSCRLYYCGMRAKLNGLVFLKTTL